MGERERVDEVAVAERLLADLDVRHPSEIAVELIAYTQRAFVLWRPSASADARVVRSGDASYLAIAEHARGTPRARFSIAHELGHHLLHADANAIERIHGEKQFTGRDHLLEAQANRFASHLLVPTALAASHCHATPPTLEAVATLATLFDVSLTVACQRWAELSPHPCAYVEASGGKIKRAVRSGAFRGEAVRGRRLEPGTLAHDQPPHADRCPPRAHDVAWGAADLGLPVVEACAPLGDRATLVWLWHAG